MRYMTFGRRAGLRVSEYALGTANFGTAWSGGAEVGEARKIFDLFAEAGGTLIDTADCYGFGQAEEFLADCLAADREHFVVSSKFTCSASAKPTVFHTGNSRRTMHRAVEESLRRLGTDHLDLYWAHFADPLTPIDEVVAALADLVRSGKVLYAGLSNFPAWRVARAVTIAELRGWTPIIAIQAEYSLVERTAEETGASPAQVAMAWLRSRSARSTTAYVPIIGPRDTAQLEDHLAALGLVLSDDQVTRLDEVSAAPLGVPHEIGRNALWSVVPGARDQLVWPTIPVA